MATTSNTTQPLEKVDASASTQNALLAEAQQHEADSYSYLSTMRKDLDNKESILLGARPEDALSAKAKSKIVDQSLASMIMERSSRVVAQLPSVEAFAESKNSVGKSMLMNIALNYFENHADEEGSLLLKFRHMNIYSHVYGSMFGLVPWRVNTRTGYVGPELLPIPIRDCRPQPGRFTIDKMEWFTVRSTVSLDWLKSLSKEHWMNIDELISDYKSRKDPGASARGSSQQNQSYIERLRYPTKKGDQVFPDIEIFTEYRYDQWITWAPRNVQNKNSKPYILRIVKNPYPENMLPIIVKHAFPLLNSIIGLGDVERGKTLQFAKNALINLYFDGVKMAIFPPLHINLNEVDPTSIKWGEAEKWYMNHPNADVQIMEMRTTEWLNTFQSTFGFLTTAIQNLSGSTSITETPGATPTLGRTPDAINQYSQNQSARDAWDTFMQEDMAKQLYRRWIALIGDKMEVEQAFKIFGADIKEIQQEFPGEKMVELFNTRNGQQRGTVSFSKKQLQDENGDPIEYSFDLEPGSMQAPNKENESQLATDVLKDFVGPSGQFLLAQIQKKGKDIDFAELYKRKLVGGGMKDWDKVIIDPQANAGTDQTLNAGTPAQPVDPTTGQPIAVTPQAGAPGAPALQQPVTPQVPQPGATPAASPQVVQPTAGMPGQQPVNPAQPAQPSGPMPTAKPMVNYKDAPDDIKRQMEAADGYVPSKQVTPQQVIDNVAQTQGMQPTVETDPELPVAPNGIRDPHIAQLQKEVLGGTGGIPPTPGQ